MVKSERKRLTKTSAEAHRGIYSVLVNTSKTSEFVYAVKDFSPGIAGDYRASIWVWVSPTVNPSHLCLISGFQEMGMHPPQCRLVADYHNGTVRLQFETRWGPPPVYVDASPLPTSSWHNVTYYFQVATGRVYVYLDDSYKGDYIAEDPLQVVNHFAIGDLSANISIVSAIMMISM
jgi:hypothetical protein